MVIVVLAVTLLTFLLVNVLPGNVLQTLLGYDYSRQAAVKLSHELNLNHPLFYRYILWVNGVIHGHLGVSLQTGQPVTTELLQDWEPTVEMVIGGQLVATVMGFVVAIASVASRKMWVDRVGSALAMLFTSLPSFVVGIVILLVFGAHWHIVPTLGWKDPSQYGWGANIGAIAVPAIVLGLGSFPGHMRIFRAELYEQLEREQYASLAQMKGISNARVFFHHVVRNSAFGLITVIAASIGFMIAGAVIIEQIFAIPGIGELIVQSVENRDSPTVEGCVMVIAIVIVVCNLLADLSYALLDPRVKDGVM